MSNCVPACFTHVTASQTRCSTQPLLAQGSRGFCVRTSCGHASCSRPSDTSKASSHKPPSPLFPTMLQHPESGIQNVVLWHDVLRACFSRTSPYCVHRGVYPLYVVIGTFEIKRVYPPCVATRDFLKMLSNVGMGLCHGLSIEPLLEGLTPRTRRMIPSATERYPSVENLFREEEEGRFY